MVASVNFRFFSEMLLLSWDILLLDSLSFQHMARTAASIACTAPNMSWTRLHTVANAGVSHVSHPAFAGRRTAPTLSPGHWTGTNFHSAHCYAKNLERLHGGGRMNQKPLLCASPCEDHRGVAGRGEWGTSQFDACMSGHCGHLTILTSSVRTVYRNQLSRCPMTKASSVR